ncbi:hypothetical protein [Photobacterium leiognathi]|uniref:hypothetical protein n=1 Tax=Photobacterium leiognathi TaxID=553611 RepID=UPI0029823A82|nr:hypothetical protein [Photobacterium leiognathi]
MSKENKNALRAKVEEQFLTFQKEIFSDGGRLDKLLNSGAIDLSEEESGYAMSSKINVALGHCLADRHSINMSKEDEKDIENINCFL